MKPTITAAQQWSQRLLESRADEVGEHLGIDNEAARVEDGSERNDARVPHAVAPEMLEVGASRRVSADPLDGSFFIGSADWMFRNLSRRVEVVTPILDRAHRETLWEILQVKLSDERQAWTLDATGTYGRVPSSRGDPGASMGTHELLMLRTIERALRETEATPAHTVTS